MTIYKEIAQHSSKGLCMVNGNKLTGWNVAFGMPYKAWDTGDTTYANGWVSSRLTETTTYDLSGLSHGQEVVMNDIMWRYCVTDGDCLNGSGNQYWKIVSPSAVTTWWRNGGSMCIDIQADNPGYTWQYYQSLGVAGIDESDEFHTNGTICFLGCATSVAGDDISISTCQLNGTITNTPTLSDIGTCGNVWIEGDNLHYTGARGWEHVICGVGSSVGGTTPGAMWVDTNHYLYWAGTDTTSYVPWRICQFASSFTGPGANPSPGAGYAGAIWADKENNGGWVNLAYIGCDGNKYLVAQGNQPDAAPS